MALNGRTRRALHALFDALYPGDARQSNGAVRDLLVHCLPHVERDLLAVEVPKNQFRAAAVDRIDPGDLEGLLVAMVRDHPQREHEIERGFRPILAWLAFEEDEVRADEDEVFDSPDLLRLVKESSRGRRALKAWLERFAPGVGPDTPNLPPVLYLVLQPTGADDRAWRITRARLCTPGERDREVPLPSQPGAPPGWEVRAGADVARAVRWLGRSVRPSTFEGWVVVIEADPTAVALAPHEAAVPGSDRRLDHWVRAVAWWPQIEGLPVDGRAHDGALPAPGRVGRVAHWRAAPAHAWHRSAVDLGVWAEPSVWVAAQNCCVLGLHDRRYFAVLGDKALKATISATHPGGAAATLEHLLSTVRGQARLVWTDRRYAAPYDEGYLA